MGILVIEGGSPNGGDLVVATRRLTAEPFTVPVVLDGVEGILRLRVIVDRGRLRYLRSAHLFDAEGRPVPNTDDGYVDEQEVVSG